MILRIMAFLFTKEYGKKYTNSEEKAGLVMFNKYPLQHVIIGKRMFVQSSLYKLFIIFSHQSPSNAFGV